MRGSHATWQRCRAGNHRPEMEQGRESDGNRHSTNSALRQDDYHQGRLRPDYREDELRAEDLHDEDHADRYESPGVETPTGVFFHAAERFALSYPVHHGMGECAPA